MRLPQQGAQNGRLCAPCRVTLNVLDAEVSADAAQAASWSAAARLALREASAGTRTRFITTTSATQTPLAPFISWGYGRRTAALLKGHRDEKSLPPNPTDHGAQPRLYGGTARVDAGSIAAEAAGENCAAGGLVTTGKDTDGNGTLDAAEVTGTDYVCNGETGARRCAHLAKHRGASWRELRSPVAIEVDFGVDGDGALTEAEVSATEYLYGRTPHRRKHRHP